MKSEEKRFFLGISVFITLLVLGESTQDFSNNETCNTLVCHDESEAILAKLDEAADPCDDFYLFACGNFMNTTIIPDDKTSVESFTVLDDKLKEQLNEILNSTIKTDDILPFVNCKRLFDACMNEELIEDQGLKPIKSVIESLGGWPILEAGNWADNVWYWQKILLNLELKGFSSNQIFEASIGIDMKNSTRRVINIDQPHLGIEREYLIKGLEDELVQAYYHYHVDSVVIYGGDRFYAEVEVKKVLNFEIELAKILIPKEERRNMTQMYHSIKIKDFQHMFPIHDWLKYFNEVLPHDSKITEDEELILTDFKFILDDLYNLLKNTPNRVVVNYLIWRTSASIADYLNKAIRIRHLEFTKILSGQQKSELRWRECVDTVSSYLPIATSALYVRNFFNKESRNIALEIVESLKNEFQNMLKSVPWMDETSKSAALEKAKKMTTHIGYPDELLDDNILIKYYKNLLIQENEFFESILKISKFESEKDMSKFRELVNRSHWETHSNVALVNAFYDPSENSIQFPAGILQGMFFNADRPRYMNYGAIGSVIGHEITHGFDDEGSQFDSDGNLVDWWEEDTKTAYLEKARCIIEQYGNYTEPHVDLKLNGINTQGENIADNGGIKEAYRAYTSYIETNGEEPTLPGLNFTAKQLFWISAAQSWCSILRPEKMKLQITVDEHAPEMFRVNGPISNMNEFFEDFECSPESRMNSEQKCEVW